MGHFFFYNETIMVIALFGADSYRRSEKAKELVAAYRAKYEHADLFSVDLEDDMEGWNSAKDFLRQPSMFVDSKVLLVREPASVTEKEWEEALRESVRAKGVVVLLSSKENPADAFPFLGEKGVERQEFAELEGRLLEVFVLREAKARGITFAPDALRFFLAYLSSLELRSARASAELDRILLAKFAAPVTRADMELLTAWLPAEDIYRGLDSIHMGKSPGERLVALERLLGGYDAARIFNTLAYAVHGPSALALAAYDIAIKSGRLEYEEALVDFSMSPSNSSGVTRAEFFLRDVI